LTDESSVISVRGLGKVYRLYKGNKDRLLDAVCPWGVRRHTLFHALQNLSFEVKRGETLGIIGQNGSGKSTLLKIVTGVLAASSGSVTTSGRIAALLELGAGFHPEFTGLENIYFNGAILGASREEIREKIPEIVAFADIGDHLHQPVKTYSSGMFVRLAFATAINVDPEILIVDEALSVGDMFFQLKCYRKFEEFKQRGKTILFVTHDMGTIVKYCDRAIVLDKGQIAGLGSAKEMVDLYKKLAVKTRKQDSNEGQQQVALTGSKRTWKSYFNTNPNLDPYGDGQATIEDYGIFDHQDRPNAILDKGESFAIRMRVQFHAALIDPIFAFTIKDKKGTEITGTNTWVEKIEIPTIKSGDGVTVVFNQSMNLQGGQYLLSLGCTGFDQNGDFVVHQRLYDVIQFDVVSSKDSVGYFDLNSHISLQMDGVT
jgi:teichoic acid transport system ATP-binding protein